MFIGTEVMPAFQQEADNNVPIMQPLSSFVLMRYGNVVKY